MVFLLLICGWLTWYLNTKCTNGLQNTKSWQSVTTLSIITLVSFVKKQCGKSQARLLEVFISLSFLRWCWKLEYQRTAYWCIFNKAVSWGVRPKWADLWAPCEQMQHDRSWRRHLTRSHVHVWLASERKVNPPQTGKHTLTRIHKVNTRTPPRRVP